MKMRTERLLIRSIQSDDWSSIQRIWEDQKRSEYARFDRPHDTESNAVRQRIEKWASFADSMEHLFFAVCLNEILIGYAAFHMQEDGCETGYCFHSDFHGKGYARESLSALILYILMLHPGTAITAGTALENLPSVKLLQTLGFRRIGTERVSFYKDADGQDIFFEGGIFKLDWHRVIAQKQ